MLDFVPTGNSKRVTALPDVRHIIDERCPAPLTYLKHVIRRGPLCTGLRACKEALHVETHGRHIRGIESDARAVEAFGVRQRGIQAAANGVLGEPERRCRGDGNDWLVLLWVLREKREPEEMSERHVEAVEPVGRGIAVVAVTVI